MPPRKRASLPAAAASTTSSTLFNPASIDDLRAARLKQYTSPSKKTNDAATPAGAVPHATPAPASAAGGIPPEQLAYIQALAAGILSRPLHPHPAPIASGSSSSHTHPAPYSTPVAGKKRSRSQSGGGGADGEDGAGDGDDVKPKKGKKKKEEKEPEEKRGKLFRKSCPVATKERLGRVKEQRMFMVHRQREGEELKEIFQILGSTGNVYTVTFQQIPTCDCPDFLKGNGPCKHLIFVALKVLHMKEEEGLWYQKAYLTPEMQSIFASAPTAPTSLSHISSANLSAAYLKSIGKAPASTAAAAATGGVEDDPRKKAVEEGDDCPVCYDSLAEGGELVYDLGSAGGCGKPVHAQCFDMWSMNLKKKGQPVTCVYCRAPWRDAAASGSSAGDGGVDKSGAYLNMAELAGMSRQRDTSSYYQGPRRGMKFRPWEYYQDD